MRQQLRSVLLLFAGLLMGFAAFVSAVISVPHLREDMVEISVRPALIAGISLGLYFGSFAMFGFALIVLAAAARTFRGAPPPSFALAIIAALYIAFGAGAFVAWNGSAHALAYVLMGALIALALLIPVPEG